MALDTPQAPPEVGDAAPMQEMLSQMLELQKGLADSLASIASKLDSLHESKEEKPIEEMKDKDKDKEEMADKAKEDEEKEMMDKDKQKASFADLERRVVETEKLLFAEKKARKEEAEMVSAKAFVAERSNERCLKIPVKFRDKAAQLIAAAPSAEYRDSLKSLMDNAADKALLFKDTTRSFSEETAELVSASGPIAAVEAKITKLVTDGKIKHRGDGYAIVFAENPSLHTEYRQAQKQ